MFLTNRLPRFQAPLTLVGKLFVATAILICGGIAAFHMTTGVRYYREVREALVEHTMIVERDKQTFQNLAAIPVVDRRHALLFVPKTYDGYWNVITEPVRKGFEPEMYLPFYGPALSGIAHLDGLPETPVPRPAMGYFLYPSEGHLQTLRPDDPKGLCVAAAVRGDFTTVYILDGGEDGISAISTVDCRDVMR
jgi:hypothetical protein